MVQIVKRAPQSATLLGIVMVVSPARRAGPRTWVARTWGEPVARVEPRAVEPGAWIEQSARVEPGARVERMTRVDGEGGDRMAHVVGVADDAAGS
jgi:hypothetical protein